MVDADGVADLVQDDGVEVLGIAGVVPVEGLVVGPVFLDVHADRRAGVDVVVAVPGRELRHGLAQRSAGAVDVGEAHLDVGVGGRGHLPEVDVEHRLPGVEGVLHQRLLHRIADGVGEFVERVGVDGEVPGHHAAGGSRA